MAAPVILLIDGLWEKLSSVLGVTIIGLILYQVAFYFVKRWGRNKKRVLPNLLQQYIYFPGLTLIFLITLILGLTFFERTFDAVVIKNIRHGLIVALIINSAILATRVLTLILELSLRRFQSEDPIDFSYRKARTKFELLQKVVNFIIILAALSAEQLVVHMLVSGNKYLLKERSYVAPVIVPDITELGTAND